MVRLMRGGRIARVGRMPDPRVIGVLGGTVSQGDDVWRSDILTQKPYPSPDVAAFVDGVNAGRREDALGTSLVETVCNGRTSEVVISGRNTHATTTKHPALLVSLDGLVLEARTCNLHVALREPPTEEVPFEHLVTRMTLSINTQTDQEPLTREDVGIFLSVLLTALPDLLPPRESILVEKTK
jgi:hypothetical protein